MMAYAMWMVIKERPGTIWIVCDKLTAVWAAATLTYGLTNYGSGLRKALVSQCVQFEVWTLPPPPPPPIPTEADGLCGRRAPRISRLVIRHVLLSGNASLLSQQTRVWSCRIKHVLNLCIWDGLFLAVSVSVSVCLSLSLSLSLSASGNHTCALTDLPVNSSSFGRESEEAERVCVGRGWGGLTSCQPQWQGQRWTRAGEWNWERVRRQTENERKSEETKNERKSETTRTILKERVRRQRKTERVRRQRTTERVRRQRTTERVRRQRTTERVRRQQKKERPRRQRTEEKNKKIKIKWRDTNERK